MWTFSVSLHRIVDHWEGLDLDSPVRCRVADLHPQPHLHQTDHRINLHRRGHRVHLHQGVH